MINPLSTIGDEEEQAVLRVVRSKVLSGYLAGSSVAGPEVSRLETQWTEFFGVKYAVACNSATSGLLAACMAIGVGWGDEVIVPFLTMSATACAPNVLGAQIVLANVDENYCIDPYHVSKLINENTKAVIATNLFGHPAKLKMLRGICDAANIILIEDNAQAIAAKEDGVYTGTIGHIGVFSLNYHKQIHAGEGGVIVTDDFDLYRAFERATNHGECLKGKSPGLNLRMTEMTAAIAGVQLTKLPDIIEQRTATAERVRDIINRTRLPEVLKIVPDRTGCINTHYAVPMISMDPYDPPSVCTWLHKNSKIPFSAGYHGNLLKLPVAEKWIKDKPSIYKDIDNLILMETCSHDIQEEHLQALEEDICDERRRTA